ncbi:unnamed protein product, partial [Ixodes hexagonus]
QNERTAQLLTVSVHRSGQQGAISRSCPMVAYCASRIAQDAQAVLAKLSSADSWTTALTNISLSATRFKDAMDDAAQDISKFLVRRSRGAVGSSSEQALPESTGQDSNTPPKQKLPEATLEKPPGGGATFSFSKKLGLLLEEPTSKKSINDKALPEKRNSGDFSLPSLHRDPTSGTEAASVGSTIGLDTKGTNLWSETPHTFHDRLRPNVSDIGKDPSCKTTKGSTFFLPKPCSSAATEMAESIDSAGEDSTRKILKEEQALGGNSSHPDHSEGDESEDGDERCNLPESLECASGLSPSDCSPGDDSTVNLDPSLVQKCERCGKVVPVWKVQEHEDYHLALDLSKPESTLLVPSLSVSKRKVSAPQVSKRKRKKARPDKVKTLKDFFR